VFFFSFTGRNAEPNAIQLDTTITPPLPQQSNGIPVGTRTGDELAEPLNVGTVTLLMMS
jgi:hypothetical protein